MCGGDGLHGTNEFLVPATPVITRRTLLAGTAAATGALFLGQRFPVPAGAAVAQGTTDLGGVPVIPRSAWAGDLAPSGPIPPEPEVRYLLVHHSVDPGNDYGEGDVAGILRGFFRFHTSQKGWPDLAYNFMVDRFGRVWEGRAGSVAGPVAGDATGGNQGFDQLCCFVGNHQEGAPSAEAFSAMGRLLGALARRYRVPVGAAATTVFTSRGSNRHPAGAQVTTATIAGHRDMSRTQCPGDRVVARLPELRVLAAAAAGTPVPPEAAAPPPPTNPPPSAGSTSSQPPDTGATTSTPPSGGSRSVGVTGSGGDGTGDVNSLAVVAGGAALAAAAGAGGWCPRGARRRAPPADGSGEERPPAPDRPTR